MSHVYIMASERNGTLYIGMTDDLNRRVWEHQTEARSGFTKRYGIHMLVWSEQHKSRETAFARERALKKWNRAWKLRLIEDSNPQWRDLALELEP
ncbi:MAG: GIY-YIG nuclease family protein [Janthinobacterium lividum]